MPHGDEYHRLNYDDNTRHYAEYCSGGSLEHQAKAWLDPETVDAWRHGRMYAALDPLLECDAGASWLTVGDGRYGKDARYIRERGGDVLATDIDDRLLAEARETGYIAKFARENAESLSFEDGCFDYVFCKESYHHFPRPMLALYEMLRVASKGVVLIEPNDRFISCSPLRQLCASAVGALLALAGRKPPAHSFEAFGNYVYCISRRELEKAALGMNYRYLAFKGLNDHYLEGVEYEKVAQGGRLLRRLRRVIFLRDLLTRLRITDYGILAAVIFKQEPAPALRKRLVREGFELVELPENVQPHGSR